MIHRENRDGYAKREIPMKLQEIPGGEMLHKICTMGKKRKPQTMHHACEQILIRSYEK